MMPHTHTPTHTPRFLAKHLRGEVDYPGISWKASSIWNPGPGTVLPLPCWQFPLPEDTRGPSAPLELIRTNREGLATETETVGALGGSDRPCPGIFCWEKGEPRIMSRGP